MASTIKIKRSTGSAAPTTLAYGELAYSSGSGKFYFGSSTDGNTVSIAEIGGAHYTNLLSATAGTASASKAVILDGSSGISGLGTVTATSFVGDVTGTVSDISNHDTDALAEGSTNLYYTDTRARASVSASDTSGSLTYDSASGIFTFSASNLASGFTTDDIAEGVNNLYFTEGRARDSISVTDVSGDGSLSYDAATGVITYTGPSASEVRAHFGVANSETGYGSIAYDSATGVFTLTKVTDANIRGAISVSGDLSYDSATGVISFSESVNSVNGATGTVVLDTDDISEGTSNLYFTEARAQAAITGGTGVDVTGGVVSIGQAVGTTDDVTFNNVTVSGSLNSDDITAASISIDGSATVTGALTVTGNLTVSGTTTTVNSTTLEVADLNITVAKGAVDASAANGAGLTVEGPATAATLTYSSADDRWNLNKDLNVAMVYGDVTGDLTGNADTATALATARDFSVSGDATASAVSFDGSAAVDLAVTLATVNSNVGEFGDSVTVPTFTVNAKGLITAASETAIPTATTTVKGLASFNTNEFTVTDGAVSVAALDGGTY